MYKSESKSTKADERESKMVIVDTCSKDNRKSKGVTVVACSTDESESKSVHEMDISVNTSKVKYTKDEPLITDNSVIKAPGYFKLFEISKEFFNLLVVTYEQACMANAKDKHWMEIYDTITN